MLHFLALNVLCFGLRRKNFIFTVVYFNPAQSSTRFILTSVENSTIGLNEKFIQNFPCRESYIQTFTPKKWNEKKDLGFLPSRVLPALSWQLSLGRVEGGRALQASWPTHSCICWGLEVLMVLLTVTPRRHTVVTIFSKITFFSPSRCLVWQPTCSCLG